MSPDDADAWRPEVALTFLAEGDLAFTARGRATIIEEPMAVDPQHSAVSIAVDHVDDHRQPAFRVTAGVDREWVDEAARAALGARVQALSNPSVPQHATSTRECAMKISSISGLTYPVKDLDRTAEFYESLGFRPGKRDDHQLTCYVNWFWVTFITHPDGELGAGSSTLYLKVDDIDDAYGSVLANGLTPSTEPRKDRSGRREFLLLDPDGNRLAFFGK